jgi:hypothetical protein
LTRVCAEVQVGVWAVVPDADLAKDLAKDLVEALVEGLVEAEAGGSAGVENLD